MDKTLKLTIAGDLAPIRGFVPLIEQDPEAVYGNLLLELRRADYRIVNLESPLWASGVNMLMSKPSLRYALCMTPSLS